MDAATGWVFKDSAGGLNGAELYRECPKSLRSGRAFLSWQADRSGGLARIDHGLPGILGSQFHDSSRALIARLSPAEDAFGAQSVGV